MRKYLRLGMQAGIGGILGFGYYYFVGCTSGTCPLTSHWYVTTIYGLSIGVILGLPSKPKPKDK